MYVASRWSLVVCRKSLLVSSIANSQCPPFRPALFGQLNDADHVWRLLGLYCRIALTGNGFVHVLVECRVVAPFTGQVLDAVLSVFEHIQFTPYSFGLLSPFGISFGRFTRFKCRFLRVDAVFNKRTVYAIQRIPGPW